MSKIMIIEDDHSLAVQIKEALEAYAYEVMIAHDFKRIEELFIKEQPDVIILDINLPYYDGNYYCRRFRRVSNVPIIMISARNSDMDQILSMELGADEYVVKPFNSQVLLAKVNAITRRTYGEYAKEDINDELVKKGLSLNLHNFTISYRDQREELSKNEYRLMKHFLTNPDTVITRDVLLEELWDTETFIDDNTLTVNVTRLKTKLQHLGLPTTIKTKRGVGYLFDTGEMGE